MDFGCFLCNDFYLVNSEVSITNCGHLFHESCLCEWLNKNPSCPECHKIPKEQPVKVYFDVNSTDTTVSLGNVQNEIDVLKSKIKVIDGEVEDLKRNITKLESCVPLLKEKAHSLKTKNEIWNGLHEAQQLQLRFLKEQEESIKDLQRRNKVLRKQLSTNAEILCLIDRIQIPDDDEFRSALSVGFNTPFLKDLNDFFTQCDALKACLINSKKNHEDERRKLLCDIEILKEKVEEHVYELEKNCVGCQTEKLTKEFSMCKVLKAMEKFRDKTSQIAVENPVNQVQKTELDTTDDIISSFSLVNKAQAVTKYKKVSGFKTVNKVYIKGSGNSQNKKL